MEERKAQTKIGRKEVDKLKENKPGLKGRPDYKRPEFYVGHSKVDENKVRLSTDTISKIIDVHRMLDRIFHHYFEQYSITSVQIPVLMTLVKHEKLMVSQLAALLHIGSSNITPLCKRLEKSGLITRTRDMEDQRVVYVSLTETAKNMMDEISTAIQYLNDWDDEVYAISDDEVQVIVDGVDVLFDYISKVLVKVTGSIDG